MFASTEFWSKSESFRHQRIRFAHWRIRSYADEKPVALKYSDVDYITEENPNVTTARRNEYWSGIYGKLVFMTPSGE